MSLDAAVMRFAGVVILVSIVLTVYVHAAWVWLTVFVGVNLIQASFTGFCPAAIIFRKLGVKPGNAFR